MSRVLILVRRLWNGGGTETYVYTLAKELQRFGHTVGIFTSGGPWVPYFRANGIQVHVCPARQCRSFLEQTIRLNGYTVIHAQDSFSYYLTQRLQNRRNLRVIFTVHGRYIHKKALKQCSHAAHAMIAVSPSLRNYVIQCGIPAYKVYLIPNGVSSSTFHPANVRNDMNRTTFRSRYGIPQGAFVIGYAGRFTVDKTALGRRISSLLRYFASTHPNTWVIIAGRNSKSVVTPTRKCIVLGHVSNMENFYHTCDAVVGTARVALESLACGKPTIAVGYTKYIGILNPTNLHAAYQSNFGDHGAVRTRWSNQELLRDLTTLQGSAGFQRANAMSLSQTIQNRYSASSMVQQILKLYR